jgi:2-methylcitrate dehydratase
MDVTTISGQHFSAAVTHPHGHFRNPMSDDDVEAKFRRLTADTMAPEQMDRVLASIWSLEAAENLSVCLDALIIT